jgi:hypothetical protein
MRHIYAHHSKTKKFFLMKNAVLHSLKSIMILAAVVFMASFRAPNGQELSTSLKMSSLSLSVNIPDQWKSAIIRVDENETTTFKLDNGNAPAVFLFSVTKIPDQQWAKVKSQMPDSKLIAHKNESIYFVQRTNKETIKGANSATYAQVYPLIDQLIQSIQITE